MLTAGTIAKYFLTKTDEEAGDTISNLKLQKLLYYAQGFHLVLRNGLLFSENIEAWRHGPVVPRVYRDYAGYEAGPIPLPDKFDPSTINEDVRDLLDEVYQVYGQFSAWRLREMTHEEPPWRNAWDPDTGAGAVSHSDLRSYFATLVE